MKKHFITGLVILLPIAVTLAVIDFLLNFLTKPFVGLMMKVIKGLPFLANIRFFQNEHAVLLFSKILIVILLVVVTIFLGILARWFFIKSLFSLGDKILRRIPIVNSVYKTTQDIIKTLFASDKNSFKQVVLAPFPKPGVFVIALISRESPKICSEKTGKKHYSVLIPTTPNPTTGFLIMYPEDELIFLDIKPEDAIKYIVSCGVITPETVEEA